MSYVLREAEVPVLPEGHAPIRILHFSDLHLTPKRKVEIADIKSWVKYSPDLVISTGDFLADMKAVPVVLDALDGLLDIPGLFVFGSNDYYAPKPKNPLKYLLPDHGKRIHVSAKQDGWAGLVALDVKYGGGDGLAQSYFTQAVYRLEDALKCLWQLQSELGDLVEITANVCQNARVFIGFFDNICIAHDVIVPPLGLLDVL